MLDVGTGSGILAIYGIRIGAERVVAVDNDPEAIRWAGRNIRLNGITGSIRLSETPVEQLGERFSLVCANLILGEILRVLPAFSHLVNPGGWLILSGILRDQLEEITRSLARNGFQEHETRYQDEWACVIATRAGRG
ncbi:MAG: 50S ribosomal protein L11 methyltransferase [Desulfobacterales bacterium]|nr:50S ribosomal protein L11 methyltransferase [Desulfobacterales bacterium]